MRKEKKLDMLSGSLADKILLFAFPLAMSSVLQLLFNSVDIAVVGHYSGNEALAAVGSNTSVVNLIITIFTGLALGANVLLGMLIGQGKRNLIKTAVQTIFIVALASGVILVAVGCIFTPSILRLIKTPENVLPLAVIYLRMYFLGMPFIMIYNFGSAILRSKGDSNRPLYALVAGGILNVILNLVFVIVFKMGVMGVGLATTISNFLSAVLIVKFLVCEEDDFRLEIFRPGFSMNHFVRIVKIGVPAGIQGLVFSLSNVCIQGAINSFGSDVMAGSAAGVNYEYFTYFFTSAFAQTCVTFTSQNYGAGNIERCSRVFRFCLLFQIICAVTMGTVFSVFSDFFSRIYTDSDMAVMYSSMRIRRVESLTLLTGFYEVAAGACRGMGYSMMPSILTMIGSCCFRLLWLGTIFRKFHTFSMLMTVYPVSWILTTFLLITCYIFVMRREKTRTDAVKIQGHSSQAS